MEIKMAATSISQIMKNCKLETWNQGYSRFIDDVVEWHMFRSYVWVEVRIKDQIKKNPKLAEVQTYVDQNIKLFILDRLSNVMNNVRRENNERDYNFNQR